MKDNSEGYKKENPLKVNLGEETKDLSKGRGESYAVEILKKDNPGLVVIELNSRGKGLQSELKKAVSKND